MTPLKNAATVVVLILAGLLVGEAQITKPHTFADGETIDAARMNANFDGVYDGALNRTGGIMTGTLTSQAIVPSSGNTYDLGTAGTRFRDLFLSGTASITGALSAATLDTGQGANELYAMNQDVLTTSSPTFGGLTVNGTVTATTFSGSGASLTSIPESAISDGSVFLRLTDAAWTGPSGGFSIVVGTSDGSDNAGININGGGAASGTRGANITICGNENTNCAGDINLSAGTGTAGSINIIGRLDSASAQPGFLAYLSASTGSGVADDATVPFDAERYDTAGNFNTTTHVFTAPVTGIYHLCATVSYVSLSGATTLSAEIVTSNQGYSLDLNSDPALFPSEAVSGCVYADMDAADTAFVRTSHPAVTSNVAGGTVASGLATYFSGRLVP